jgi:O-antigen/teichoic acid export membrane protein
MLAGVVSNWLLLGTTLVIGFVLTPIVIKRIGTDNFGVWGLVASFIGFYNVLNLGALSAVNRFIALYSGSGNREELNRVVSTATAMFFTTGLIVVILSHALAGQMAVFFKVSPDDVPPFTMLVRLIGILTGVNFIGYVPGAVLRAHERFISFNIINILAELLRFGLTLVLTSRGYGLRGLAYALLARAVVALILHTLLCRLLVPHVKISLGEVRWRTFRSLIGFGVFVFITYLGDLLRIQVDAMIIGRYLSMEAVGIYGIATMLVLYMLQVCVGLSNVFSPRLANLYGKGDLNAFKASIMRYATVMGSFAIGISVPAVLVSEDFIVLWVGESFRPAALLFLVLMIGMSLDFANLVGLSALQAMKKHHYYAFNSIAEGAAKVILSIVLVQRLGMIGVALGTTIPALITRLGILPLYTTQVAGLPYGRYVAQTLLRPGVAALVIYGLMRVLPLDHARLTLPWLVVQGVLVTAAYAALLAALLLFSGNGCLLLRRYVIEPAKTIFRRE